MRFRSDLYVIEGKLPHSCAIRSEFSIEYKRNDRNFESFVRGFSVLHWSLSWCIRKAPTGLCRIETRFAHDAPAQRFSPLGIILDICMGTGAFSKELLIESKHLKLLLSAEHTIYASQKQRFLF